jgi:hypothetical protein
MPLILFELGWRIGEWLAEKTEDFLDLIDEWIGKYER